MRPGAPTRRSYTRTTSCSSDCTWPDLHALESIHGQWSSNHGTVSDQNYDYDAAGRLSHPGFDRDLEAGLMSCREAAGLKRDPEALLQRSIRLALRATGRIARIAGEPADPFPGVGQARAPGRGRQRCVCRTQRVPSSSAHELRPRASSTDVLRRICQQRMLPKKLPRLGSVVRHSSQDIAKAALCRAF
jgi:hypothetical protein